MAVVPERRGEGHAGELLERCLAHALEHGGLLAWCTARAPAEGLYRRFGFAPVGEVFDVPEIGPHVEMRRPLG